VSWQYPVTIGTIGVADPGLQMYSPTAGAWTSLQAASQTNPTTIRYLNEGGYTDVNAIACLAPPTSVNSAIELQIATPTTAIT
jgi:hypothetical protein